MKKIFNSKIIFAILTLVLACCSMFTLACAKKPSDNGGDDKTTFSLNYHLKEISLYDTLQLSVKGYIDLAWSSSDSAKVSVDDNGLVVANAYGQATITVTDGTNSDTCIIVVLDEGKVPVVNTNVNDDMLGLLLGDTFDIDCAILFNNNEFNDASFVFETVDPNVCEVSVDGVVTAKAYGQTEIRIVGSWRNFDNSYLTKTINVSVNPDVNIQFSVQDSLIYNKSEMVEGVSYDNTTQLSVVVKLEGQDVTNTADIEYVVSDSTVVEVSSLGEVTGLNRGTATIICRYTVNDRSFDSLPVTITVGVPIKTITTPLYYEVGKNGCIPSSLFEGTPMGIKMGPSDYTDKATFINGDIVFEEKTANDFLKNKINFTVLTEEYDYSLQATFVTHDIDSLDELLEFLNYSGASLSDGNLTGGYYAVLTADINFNGAKAPAKAHNSTRFLGYFDGLGHTISNFTIDSAGGIFGGLWNCTIKNVAFTNVVGTGTADKGTLIAGHIYPNVTINNIYVQGTFTNTKAWLGAFYSPTNSLISNMIIDITYPENSVAEKTYATGVALSVISNSNLPKQILTIGNADYMGARYLDEESTQIENYQDVVYPTAQACALAGLTQINADNGWSEFWQVKDYGLFFGGKPIILNAGEQSEKTAYGIMNEFDFTKGTHKAVEMVEIDLKYLIGNKTADSAFIGSYQAVSITDGVASFDPSNFIVGSEYTLYVAIGGEVYSQPIVMVSHLVSTAEEMKDVLKYAGTSATNQNEDGSLVNPTKNYYVILGADIDMQGYTVDKHSAARWWGTFDGMGYAITNVKTNNTGGVFGCPQSSDGVGGIIRNLAVDVTCTVNGTLLTGHSFNGTVENVYIKGRFTHESAHIGAGYAVNSFNNCIFDITYSETNTAETTYVFNGKGESASLGNVYAIGNADKLQPKSEVVPFATADDMVNSVANQIDLKNGWDNCWSVDGFGIWLFDRLVVSKKASQVLEPLFVEYYDFNDGTWSEDGYITIDLSEYAGTITGVIANGVRVSDINNSIAKIPTTGLVPGNSYELLLLDNDKVISQPIEMVSHLIDTADKFLAFFESWQSSTATITKQYYALLTADIDGATATNAKNALAQCVGQYYSSRFYGYFDGQGHTVSNIMVNNSCLFGSLQVSGSPAIIKNVAFVNVVATNRAILLGQTFGDGGTLENVYVKGSSNATTAANANGVTYLANNTKIRNCVFDVTFTNLGSGINSYAFEGGASKVNELHTNVYTLGNATYATGGSTQAPYTEEELITALADKINAENGWAKYWQVKGSSLWFGNTIVASKPNATIYKSTYGYADGVWTENTGDTKINLATLLGENPKTLLINGVSTALPANYILDVSSYTLGATNVITVSGESKFAVQPFVFATHAISDYQQMNAFLKSYGDDNNADTSATAEYYAVLTTDIDYNGTNLDNANSTDHTSKNFNAYYQGVFDGLGNTISNMVFPDVAGYGYQGGIFGGLKNGGTLKNFAIVNCTVEETSAPIVAGDIRQSTIENVYVKATKTIDGSYGLFYQFVQATVKNVIADIACIDGATKTSYAFTGKFVVGSAPSNCYAIGNSTYKHNNPDTAMDFATANAFAKAIYDGTITPSGFNSYWKFEKTEKGATIKFGKVVVGSYTAE